MVIMDCQFEEKQYEQHLNNELVSRGMIYIPGQRFEHFLGIDAALFSLHKHSKK